MGEKERNMRYMKMHICARYDKGYSPKGVNKAAHVPTPSTITPSTITFLSHPFVKSTTLRNRMSYPQRAFNHTLKKLNEVLSIIMDAELKAGNREDEEEKARYAIQVDKVHKQIRVLLRREKERRNAERINVKEKQKRRLRQVEEQDKRNKRRTETDQEEQEYLLMKDMETVQI